MPKLCSSQGRLTTTFPCCNCCTLVAGSVLVAFIYLLVDCLYALYLTIIFIHSEKFVIETLKWSTSCASLKSSTKGDSSDVDEKPTTLWSEYHLLISFPLRIIYILMDILLFLGITENLKSLIATAFVASSVRVAEQLATVILVALSCNDERRNDIAFPHLLLSAYCTAVLYSRWREMAEEALATAQRAEEPSRRAADVSVGDEDDDADYEATIQDMMTMRSVNARPANRRRVSMALSPTILPAHSPPPPPPPMRHVSIVHSYGHTQGHGHHAGP